MKEVKNPHPAITNSIAIERFVPPVIFCDLFSTCEAKELKQDIISDTKENTIKKDEISDGKKKDMIEATKDLEIGNGKISITENQLCKELIIIFLSNFSPSFIQDFLKDIDK